MGFRGIQAIYVKKSHNEPSTCGSMISWKYEGRPISPFLIILLISSMANTRQSLLLPQVLLVDTF